MAKDYIVADERAIDEWAWHPVATIYVFDRPKPQPRPRGRVMVGKRYDPKARFTVRTFLDLSHVHIYQPKAGMWTTKTLAAMKKAKLKMLVGPVRVDITFVMGRPKDYCKTIKGRFWYPRQPDRDNLDKVVLDCMQQTDLLENDGQVCAGELVKVYSAIGEEAHAEIMISTLKRRRRWFGPRPKGA